MMTKYTPKDADAVRGDATTILAQLRAIRAAKQADDEALRADTSRTAIYKAVREQQMRSARQAEALQLLQSEKILDRIQTVSTMAPVWRPEMVARRGKFADGDPQAERLERLLAALTLPQEALGDLQALADDALATGRTGLADAIRREAWRRTRQPGADDADRQVALTLERAVTAALPASDPDNGADTLRELSLLRQALEREFSAIGKPAPVTASVSELASGPAPMTRLREHRATEAAAPTS